MKTSNKVAASLVAAALVLAVPVTKLWEGKRNTTYDDIAGVATACYGQTGSKVQRGATYSDTTCDSWLAEELTEYIEGVIACVDRPMLPHQAAALGVFAYNVGVSGACSSAAAKYARSNDWKNACRALQINDQGQPAWSYITKNGKRVFVQGLANRRAAERRLCEGRV